MREANDEALRTHRLDMLAAKLEPSRIRATLCFSALFQVTHELIKVNVVDSVKRFYGFADLGDSSDWMGSGEAEYVRRVLDRAPGNPFTASVSWLVESNAITASQAHRLRDIYAHRHDLTHELTKFLLHPDYQPDFQLLSEAMEILKSLARFWTDIEISTGLLDDHQDASADEVVPLQLWALQLFLDAYLEGLRTNDVALVEYHAERGPARA